MAAAISVDRRAWCRSGRLRRGFRLRSPAMAVEPVPLLLLSGPPGVGKTTVSWEIFDQLVAAGCRPALVDIDILGACWPVPDDDPYNDRLKAHNIGSVWQNFHAAGAHCLIAAGVVADRAILDLYSAAIPGAVPTLCRLRAGHAELRDRILRRGRERGDDVDRLYRRAVYLDGALEQNDVAAFTVDTDQRSVSEVARRVLAQAGGWPHAVEQSQPSTAPAGTLPQY